MIAPKCLWGRFFFCALEVTSPGFSLGKAKPPKGFNSNWFDLIFTEKNSGVSFRTIWYAFWGRHSRRSPYFSLF